MEPSTSPRGERAIYPLDQWARALPMSALGSSPPTAGIVMPSAPTVTVVLARFDDLLARGLRDLIESDSSLTILAAEVEHERIGVVLRAHRPDVAILDIGALGKLAEIRELSGSHPATRLL